jgi:hypothetical protein
LFFELGVGRLALLVVNHSHSLSQTPARRPRAAEGESIDAFAIASFVS